MSAAGATARDAIRQLKAALASARVDSAGEVFVRYRAIPNGKMCIDAGAAVRPENIDALRRAGLEIGETVSGNALRGVVSGMADPIMLRVAMMSEIAGRGLVAADMMWERHRDDTAEIEVIWPVSEARD